MASSRLAHPNSSVLSRFEEHAGARADLREERASPSASRRARRLLVPCLWLLGCGPALHPLPADPITDPDLLLTRFARRTRTVGVLEAEARIEHYGETGVVKGRVTLLADPAGRLRADAWTPTDQHLATLTADRETFLYFERGAPECLTGLSCPRNLARLLPVGLGVREAVGVLAGVPPVYPASGPWALDFDRRVGAYLLRSPVAGDAVQRLWVLEDGTPVRAELDAPGGRVYRVEFSRFEERGGRRLPMRIHVQVPAERRDVTIRYRSLDPDARAAPGDFEFSCPEGLPVRTAACHD